MKYEIIHECDLEDGNPTCWDTRTPDGSTWWIDLLPDGRYGVTNKKDEWEPLVYCKSLSSAKHWISRYWNNDEMRYL